MQIPKKVRICGLDYEVIFSDDLYLTDGCYGTHNSSTLQITLQNHTLNRQRQEQVFLHELMHAVDVHYLNNKLSEDQVDQIANGIFQIMRDNDFFNRKKDK